MDTAKAIQGSSPAWMAEMPKERPTGKYPAAMGRQSRTPLRKLMGSTLAATLSSRPYEPLCEVRAGYCTRARRCWPPGSPLPVEDRDGLQIVNTLQLPPTEAP